MDNERQASTEIVELMDKLNVKSKKELNSLKARVCKKYKIKGTLSNIKIICNTDYIVKNKLILSTKPVRTASGVTPVAIMTSPANCPHGRCTFCPGGINSSYGSVPQSYTGKEPATMRGIRNDYDSYLQVFNRLEQFTLLNQSITKVELIIMGGTFPARDPAYQEEFVKHAFKAMNDFSDLFFRDGSLDLRGFKEFFELPGEVKDFERSSRLKNKILMYKGECDLNLEKIRNETSNVRCVACCVETKPDFGKLVEGNRMLDQGVTRIELGVQSLFDDVLKHVNRGHTIEDSVESIRVLKDLGFKISVHWMPGLPLTSWERDIEGFKRLFSDPDFKPDMLKIYPCMVAPGTKLYIDYKKGLFNPLSTDEAASLIAELKQYVPRYCRIQRIQRDVPTKQWTDGVGITNLRQYIHDKYKPRCVCISCREPRGRPIKNNFIIDVIEYDASGGEEFFISINDECDIILGFCRLRFPSQSLTEEITDESALIRELHVYGVAADFNEEGNVQHRGLGKMLMEKAEEIAKEHGKGKIVIISGVGVRPYYYKLGYVRDGPYVSKKIL